MKPFLLIETGDPHDGGDANWTEKFASELARNKTPPTIFLTENGVFGARAGCANHMIQKLIKNGATVYADQFALNERGIKSEDLTKGVTPAAIGVVVEHMMDESVLIWR